MSHDVIRVDFGLFAHNEAAGIARTIADLAAQDVFGRDDIDVRCLILANGCSDDTAASAAAAIPEGLQGQIQVMDLPQGGKSRTVHRFIHSESRADAGLLEFMDADIRMPVGDTLSRMVDQMQARPDLRAFTSRPVKDVEHDRIAVGPLGRIIAASGGGLSDWRKSICGQLYLLRAEVARDVGLPLGLPVEDGFMRAMVLTDLFSQPEDTGRIDGDPDIFHVYDSIRGLGELVHHQTRIVVGSAVNAALYRRFRRDAADKAALQSMLHGPAQDEDWLRPVLSEELPARPFGYVPFSFLTKRLTLFRKRSGAGAKGWAILMAGLGFDALVWCLASYRMWRGQAAGFW